VSRILKKLLILGATGMAGHVVYHYFKKKPEYIVYTACFRNKIDAESVIVNVRDELSVTKMIDTVNPDVVINCIGVLIKGSKLSVENAIYINSYFPHMLSRVLHDKKKTAKLIHISTDCVFSGNKGNYSDYDEKDALDIYGMSKNLGEVINDHDVTIRTSIIGPELKDNGEGLFHWVFSQRINGSLNGYSKSIWGGVTTLELARVIDFCLTNHIVGLYQASNNLPITKYELITKIVKEFQLDLKVIKVDGITCDKSIRNTLLEGCIYSIPDYSVMLADLHEFMIEHKELYKQYLGDENE
jgi:dTDP-4-dehydrorhamnose reductase